MFRGYLSLTHEGGANRPPRESCAGFEPIERVLIRAAPIPRARINGADREV